MPGLGHLGRYELKRVLGRGAMGVVYEGLDPALHRRVAVKTILKNAAIDEETERAYAERFAVEAKAVARLNHPHIVQVYDFRIEGDVAYLVMEYIEGRELRSHFAAGERFEPAQAVRIMGELLEALEFAHEAGVIHRDVKPANVMLDARGRVKLTDFGVARVQDSERSATNTMVGTPAYMSPEQIRGGKVDRRSDLFSAGVVLYQLLTGEQPFRGEGAWTVARKIMQEEPPAPSTVARSVSPAFDAIVARALAKDPAKRYASAREFAGTLQRALDEPLPAPHESGARIQELRAHIGAPVDKDATVAMEGKAVALPHPPPSERKASYAMPAIAAVVVIAVGIGAYLLIGGKEAEPMAQAPVAPKAEAPALPAKPEVTAAELERIRQEAEERIRREYADKTAAEQAAAAKAASEKAVQEKQAALKAVQEKAVQEKAAQEKAAAEKAAAEKAAAATAAAEKELVEKLVAERLASERAALQRAAAEKAAAEKAAATTAAAEKATAAQTAADKHKAALERFTQRVGRDKVLAQEPPNFLGGAQAMNYGEIVYVNDGTCGPGRILEVTGVSVALSARPTAPRLSRCIPLE